MTVFFPRVADSFDPDAIQTVDIGAFESQVIIPSVGFDLSSSIVGQNADTFSVTVTLSSAPTTAVEAQKLLAGSLEGSVG